MDIKNTILIGSGTLVLTATGLGICTALFGHDPENMVRLTTVASILGTGSIGLFFVGLAFPKRQQPVRIAQDGVTQNVQNNR